MKGLGIWAFTVRFLFERVIGLVAVVRGRIRLYEILVIVHSHIISSTFTITRDIMIAMLG